MRIIIRAVKERAEFIDYLQKHLPNAEWCFDKTKNAMDTFLDAMQMAGLGASGGGVSGGGPSGGRSKLAERLMR
jgi:hypothetical protein